MLVLFFWWAVGLSITTFSVSWVVRKYRDIGFALLLSFFSIYVVSANILVPRLVSVNLTFTSAVVVTGSLIWPFTSQLIDMINEIYGRKRAYAAIATAFTCNLLFVTFIWLARASGATPIWSASQEAFWQSYFVPAPRILFASMAAAIIAMSIDVFLFDSLRRKFWNRERQATPKNIAILAGVRAITSDTVNMAVDGPLFAVLAFGFVLPFDEILQIAFGSMILKIFLSLLDKPWFIAFRLLTRDVERTR